MKEDYVISSGNIFKDLDFENPEEELAKVKLASIINDIIEAKGLAQGNNVLRLNKSQISDLKDGRLKDFSIEGLFSLLEALDQHIEIIITDRLKANTEQRITVAHI